MNDQTALAGIVEPHLWYELLADIEKRLPGRKKKLESYRELIQSGEIVECALALLKGEYRFSLPAKKLLDKKGTSNKKTIYIYPPKNELLLKGVNRIVQDKFKHLVSPLCHSFQKHKGAKTAFSAILRDRAVNQLHCLRLDIRNYFNSVDVEDFMSSVPSEMRDDRPLMNLLEEILLEKRSLLDDGSIVDEQKGLMAGTPLAPFLSNIYLTELDRIFEDKGITYVRYSDDIILFADDKEIDKCYELIREYLHARGLEINAEKSSQLKPGEPWEYLGFRYENGRIDLSAATLRKAKGKIRRLARRYDRFRSHKDIAPDDVARRFIRRINRKHYGIGHEDNDLCWAKWFFPVLTESRGVEDIDEFVQEKIRFVACGNYSRRNFKVMPYGKMIELGYVPLHAAWREYRRDEEGYREMISERVCRSESKT